MFDCFIYRLISLDNKTDPEFYAKYFVMTSSWECHGVVESMLVFD